MENVVGQGRTEAGGVRMQPKDALTLQLPPCSQDTHEERQKSTPSLDFRVAGCQSASLSMSALWLWTAPLPNDTL